MMKKIILPLVLILLIVACSEDENSGLSMEETESLKFTAEQEKLSVELYLYAFSAYNLPIFQEIANKKTRHLTEVRAVMEDLDVEDPTEGIGVGVFNNTEIQTLYNQMRSRIEEGQNNAFIAALTVEESIIHFSGISLSETSNNTLIELYEAIICGSKNHFRTFYSELTTSKSYVSQYFTQEEFSDIVNSGQEDCDRGDNW